MAIVETRAVTGGVDTHADMHAAAALDPIGGTARRRGASLVRLGTQLRNWIHAVTANHGYDRSASYWTGPGRGWLAELDLPAASREIITDCLAVTGGLALVIERPAALLGAMSHSWRWRRPC
jgi:hypothetical protein